MSDDTLAVLDEWVSVLQVLAGGEAWSHYATDLHGAQVETLRELREAAALNVRTLARSIDYDRRGGLRESMVVALVNHPRESDETRTSFARFFGIDSERIDDCWSLHS